MVGECAGRTGLGWRLAVTSPGGKKWAPLMLVVTVDGLMLHHGVLGRAHGTRQHGHRWGRTALWHHSVAPFCGTAGDALPCGTILWHHSVAPLVTHCLVAPFYGTAVGLCTVAPFCGTILWHCWRCTIMWHISMVQFCGTAGNAVPQCRSPCGTILWHRMHCPVVPF